MKRTLLFAFSTTLLLAANAQTVIYSDDFESFTAGDMVAATDPDNWAIWPGGGDQVISTAFASSGTNSIACIAATAAGGPGDLLLRLGDRTTGSYALSWNMYVPAGKGGYFNIQHIEIPSGNGSFAAEVILLDGGTISGMAAGAALTGTFPQDAWFSVAMAFDLGAMTAVITVDGNVVSVFAFNTLTDGMPGPNQLGSIDFFSYGGGAPAVGEFYIDDVFYVDLSNVSIGENSARNAFSIYPVPANDLLSIANGNANGAASWQLVDLNGRVVMNAGHTIAAGTTDQVDISSLASGIYMMEIESGNARERHRIVRN